MSTTPQVSPEVTFGRVVAAHRLLRGLSAAGAASIMATDAKEFSRVENGHKRVSAQWARLFANSIIDHEEPRSEFRSAYNEYIWGDAYEGSPNAPKSIEDALALLDRTVGETYAIGKPEQTLNQVERLVRDTFLLGPSWAAVRGLHIASHWRMVMDDVGTALDLARESRWVARGIKDHVGLGWGSLRMATCARFLPGAIPIETMDSISGVESFLKSKKLLGTDDARARALEHTVFRESVAAIVAQALYEGQLNCRHDSDKKIGKRSLEMMLSLQGAIARDTRAQRSRDVALQGEIIINGRRPTEEELDRMYPASNSTESVASRISRIRTITIGYLALGRRGAALAASQDGLRLSERFGFKLARRGFEQIERAFQLGRSS